MKLPPILERCERLASFVTEPSKEGKTGELNCAGFRKLITHVQVNDTQNSFGIKDADKYSTVLQTVIADLEKVANEPKSLTKTNGEHLLNLALTIQKLGSSALQRQSRVSLQFATEKFKQAATEGKVKARSKSLIAWNAFWATVANFFRGLSTGVMSQKNRELALNTLADGQREFVDLKAGQRQLKQFVNFEKTHETLMAKMNQCMDNFSKMWNDSKGSLKNAFDEMTYDQTPTIAPGTVLPMDAKEPVRLHSKPLAKYPEAFKQEYAELRDLLSATTRKYSHLTKLRQMLAQDPAYTGKTSWKPLETAINALIDANNPKSMKRLCQMFAAHGAVADVEELRTAGFEGTDRELGIVQEKSRFAASLLQMYLDIKGWK
jgi:hypothetical protein